jgi:hypothetical protein
VLPGLFFRDVAASGSELLSRILGPLNFHLRQRVFENITSTSE